MQSKQLNMRAHARQRARQRYGLSLNKAQRREIIALIQSDKATFVKRHSIRVGEFNVPFLGRDRDRKESADQ